MGVKNLWDIIEPCKKTLPLHHLQNKRLCIDLSCWIVQLQNVNKSRISIQEKLYLKGLFHRLRALIALNCSLIFVTDGAIPAVKLATYRQRLNLGSEVTKEETNFHEACSLRRNMGSRFSCMIKEAKILGLALGIPCLDGVEEAEAQCALLNSESLCDGCFTSDSDAFLFGARTVYRDICLGEGGYVVCYEMADIERKLGFGRNSLITLALLLGSDYSHGIHGLGPESACQIVMSIGENNVLQKVVTEGLSFARKTRTSKKQTQLNLSVPEPNVGIDKHLQRQNQFLQVINAYLKPKCQPADSETVYRALSQLPFQRAKLQEVCAQFFGWMPEKTDEYILPKIAERDLRRFANLRLTSSELGVNPPLHKIPVKCPVSGIVKTRKVQGRECFEVLWEGLDGLETSIVPADLVVSACPEKIAEFVEKKALKKKQNHRKLRTKKSENISSVAEIDSMLQALSVDIEPENNTNFSYFFPSKELTSEDSTTTITVHDTKQHLSVMSSGWDCHAAPSSCHAGSSLAENDIIDLLSPSKELTSEDSTTAVTVHDTKQDLSVMSQSGGNCQAAPSSCSAGWSLVENDIIDLLSPSPLLPRPPRIHVGARCQQTSDQRVDVIDLSDSETELSPEHAKKARELRLFLTSIREDIS